VNTQIRYAKSMPLLGSNCSMKVPGKKWL